MQRGMWPNMPILGVVASSITANVSGNMYWLASGTGNGSSNTVTINSIPTTYKHLVVRATVRDSRSGSFADTIQMQFNNDSSTNYSRIAMRGINNSTFQTFRVTNQQASGEFAPFELCSAGSTNSLLHSANVSEILNYSSSTMFKTIRTFGGYVASATAASSGFAGGTYASTTPITRIDFTNNGSSSFSSDTRFDIYGLVG
jgi:hypothetical protein